MVQIEGSILELYFREVDIVISLPVSQQSCLKYIGCAEELLSISKDTAVSLVV